MLQGISTTQAFIDALAGLVLNVAAIALSIGITAYVSKKRWHARVQRLFKVNRLTNSAIRLRLSRIQVIAKGTMGVIPITKGFEGGAMTEAEYQYARELAATIQSPPLVGLFREIAERLELKSVGIPLICDIGLSNEYSNESPEDSVDLRPGSSAASLISSQLRSGPHVLIGSPVYNVLTQYVLRYSKPYGFFEYLPTPDRGFNVLRFKKSEEADEHWQSKRFNRLVLEPNTEEPTRRYCEYFIVQKFPANKFGSIVFLCCGTCTAATALAVSVLDSYLRDPSKFAVLESQFGGDQFAVLHRVELSDREKAPERDTPRHQEWPFSNWSLSTHSLETHRLDYK